jgi:3-phosphoshikimate 1-carboxyvinyltransferase
MGKICAISPSDQPIRAEITVPPDKSIAHRALILSAIAHGQSYISAIPNGADVLTTLSILRSFGVKIIEDEGLWITGQPENLNSNQIEKIDCQNSGTTIRLLTGLLAGLQIPMILSGDASLSKRPMRRVIDPLTQMGANLQCTLDDFPPISIEKSLPLCGIKTICPVASAQVKSAILLAGLFAKGETCVQEIIPTRDHTERLMALFKVRIKQSKQGIILAPGPLQAAQITIPGDISSAMFFITLAALIPGSDLRLRNIEHNPTRMGGIALLRKMGANITEFSDGLRVQYTKLKAIDIVPADVPYAVDEIPVILIACALAEGQTVLKGAQELRKKECDRLAAMAVNLRAFGVPVVELPDGLIIEGQSHLKGAKLHSFGDHRIAMACSIGGSAAQSESTITSWEAVNISFPEFEKIGVGIGMSLQVQ